MSDPNPIVVQTGPVVASQNIVVQARPAPAFQSNAFFNPAFQTVSHSQMAFQKCAFSHTAFQTDECENDGRSGYWRLFFTKMQEEALRKKDEKEAETTQAEETVGRVAPVSKGNGRDGKRKAPKPSQVEPQEGHVEKIPPFRPKPIYSVTPEEKWLQFAWLTKIEVQNWLLEMRPHLIIDQLRKLKEAANDADYRLRLLLLAA